MQVQDQLGELGTLRDQLVAAQTATQSATAEREMALVRSGDENARLRKALLDAEIDMQVRRLSAQQPHVYTVWQCGDCLAGLKL